MTNWILRLNLRKKLLAVVAASFVGRLIVFFVLPNTPSSLAPDEGTYASLTKWIGQSKPADQYPSYGEDLYLSGRSIIVPSSFLFRIGMHELDSVRLVSTLYGLCGLIIVVALILMWHKERTGISLNRVYNENLIVGLVFVFAFLPSHFIWSTLGLRESTAEFWLLATFGIFFMIYHVQKKITMLGLSTLVASIVLTFSARPQVGWVIGITLVVYLLFNLHRVDSYFLMAIVVCGVILGSIQNLGSTGSIQNLGSTGSVLTEAFKPLLGSGEIVSYKQKMNQLDATSVIEPPRCPLDTPAVVSVPPTKLETYLCLVWKAPYMVSTFLFRPVLGADVTSEWSFIAAIENIFWLFLVMTIVALAIRRRCISFLSPILPALIFFALYVLGASAYQGNMGTGFRHKSLILWAVLLLIFALAWRRHDDASTKQRNNSQESAV